MSCKGETGPGDILELEEIIVTESREQTRVSPSAPRHLVVAGSGQTPGTGHWLLTTTGDWGICGERTYLLSRTLSDAFLFILVSAARVI